MEWKSVEKDGLPEPDDHKTYFLKLLDDYGYGTYEEELEFSHYEALTMTDGKVINVPIHIPTGEKYWYLDFDNIGLGHQITHYMEIIDPV